MKLIAKQIMQKVNFKTLLEKKKEEKKKKKKPGNWTDLFWWRSKLSFFLLRQNYKMRKRIFEFNQTQSLTFPPNETCIVQHIRHGDSNQDQRSNISHLSTLSNYVNFSIPYLNELNTKNIFLMTDDGDVIDEAKSRYGDLFRWVFIEKPMFHGWAANKELHVQHFPTQDKQLEIASILLSWHTAARCQVLVGALSEVFELFLKFLEKRN